MQGLGSVLGPQCGIGPGSRIYWARKLGGIFVVLGRAVLSGVPVFEVRLLEDLQILRLRMKLEIEPSLFCP